MRPSKLIAIGVSGCALAAAAMMPALASTGHHSVASTHQFGSTLNTHSPHKGQTLLIRGHGAKKNTSYSCVLTVVKGSTYVVDLHSLKGVKSGSNGKVSCRQTYKPYTATSLTGGKSHKCPLTKKDKKAHWKCGIAVSTTDKSSATIQYFSPK